MHSYGIVILSMFTKVDHERFVTWRGRKIHESREVLKGKSMNIIYKWRIFQHNTFDYQRVVNPVDIPLNLHLSIDIPVNPLEIMVMGI